MQQKKRKKYIRLENRRGRTEKKEEMERGEKEGIDEKVVDEMKER